MPNDCMNTLTLKGKKKDIRDFIKKHCPKMEFDFETIIPSPKRKEDCPPEYFVTKDSHIQEEEDRPWFDWYKWQCDKWGSKWNAYNNCVNDVDASFPGTGDDEQINFSICFDTAWSPAEPIMQEIIAMYPNLHPRFTFYEPGMAFGGIRSMKRNADYGDGDAEYRRFTINEGYESKEFWEELDKDEESDGN